MKIVEGFLKMLQKYMKNSMILECPHVKEKRNTEEFLKEVMKIMKNSEECFVAMTIYFGRLVSRHNCLVSEANMHKFIFVAGVMALKIFDDFALKNSQYALISGFSNKDLNYLETKFLISLDYELTIASEEYQNCLKTLLNNEKF